MSSRHHPYRSTEQAMKLYINVLHDAISSSPFPYYILTQILLIEERNFTITAVALSSSIFPGCLAFSNSLLLAKRVLPGRRLQHYYCSHYHY